MSTELKVRVWVPEVWDIVTLAVTREWTVARLKAEALSRATGRAPDPAGYEVKFRGASVFDETTTLAALGTPDDAPIIVLKKRRQPVR